MAYQALLFCPEEKTARTVTQVLGELEFSVEPCSEPFAAVKKLMSQHFDALVVDCDNEQNATLLFKSARNSTSNQTSLAVAIVEGQAGVAKAFRIGANLVLTKPINVEQSKGTLRVARGLLRKGDPGKPVAPAASVGSMTTPAPQPATPRASEPVKPQVNLAPASTRPTAPAPAKPAAVIPAAQTAVARTMPAPEAKIPEHNVPDSPVVPAVPAASIKPVMPPPPTAPADTDILELEPTAPVERPRSVAASEAPVGGFGGGAAAPAPARGPAAVVPEPVAQAVAKPEKPSVAEDLFEKPAEAPKTGSITSSETEPSPSQSEAAPSFSFGSGEEASGRSKRIIIGLVAMLAVAGGIFFGWSHFQGHASQPATAATLAPVNSAPQQPASTAPAKAPVQTPLTPQSENKSVAEKSSLSSAARAKGANAEDSSSGVSSSSKEPVSSSAAGKPAPKSAAEPLVVKSGTAPAIQETAASAVSAPSLVGIAAAGSNGALSNILSVGGDAPQPVLQTLNISQGVSQGLLTKKVQPIYPRNALTMHIEGAVELMATISKTGSITAVKVLRGEPQLSRAAVEAVKQWKYRPYKLDGQPVEIQTQITVVFKLPN